MSCGTPVIASRVGGLATTVSDDTGLLFNPNDPQSLADSMSLFIEDPNLSETLGRCGPERVKMLFNPQKQSDLIANTIMEAFSHFVHDPESMNDDLATLDLLASAARPIVHHYGLPAVAAPSPNWMRHPLRAARRKTRPLRRYLKGTLSP
jgi:hypothetical protein